MPGLTSRDRVTLGFSSSSDIANFIVVGWLRFLLVSAFAMGQHCSARGGIWIASPCSICFGQFSLYGEGLLTSCVLVGPFQPFLGLSP